MSLSFLRTGEESSCSFISWRIFNRLWNARLRTTALDPCWHGSKDTNIFPWYAKGLQDLQTGRALRQIKSLHLSWCEKLCKAHISCRPSILANLLPRSWNYWEPEFRSLYCVLLHSLVRLLNLHNCCMAPFNSTIGINSSFHVSSTGDVVTLKKKNIFVTRKNVFFFLSKKMHPKTRNRKSTLASVKRVKV